MAYTPTVWETGDVITAEKLNNAEQGIAGNSPLMVNITVSNNIHTMSETYKTIADALDEGRRVVFVESGYPGNTLYPCSFYGSGPNGEPAIALIVATASSVSTDLYTAETEDDYPTFNDAA